MEFKKKYKKGDELGLEFDEFLMECLMNVCKVKEGHHADLSTVSFKKDASIKIIIE